MHMRTVVAVVFSAIGFLTALQADRAEGLAVMAFFLALAAVSISYDWVAAVALMPVAVGAFQLFTGQPAWGISGLLIGAGIWLTARTYGRPSLFGWAALVVGVGIATGWSVVPVAALMALVTLVFVAPALLWPRSAADIVLLDSEVMRGAAPHVTALEGAGFRQVGALRVPFPLKRVVDTILLSESGTTYAEVTDHVSVLTILFGQRRLVTVWERHRGPLATPARPSVLRQLVTSGSIESALAGHDRALALLAQRGVEPDRLTDDRATAAALGENRRAVDAITRTRWRSSARIAVASSSSDRPLDDDSRAEQRIDDWLAGVGEPMAPP